MTEFEDFFTSCPEDELKTKGLIAEIKWVVDVKDSLTRMISLSIIQLLYNYPSAGSKNIEHMKELAAARKGLNTFINKFVKNKYTSRLR